MFYADKKDYQEMSDKVNAILGTKKLSPNKLQEIVAKARNIRHGYGIKGLVSYASELLSPTEVKKIKSSPDYPMIVTKLAALLVKEKVITKLEARFILKRI